MGVLILTPDIRADLDALVAFAIQREHWYRPDEADAIVPGMRGEFTRVVGTYRVVFTITERLGRLYRHMSMSSLMGPALPNPVIIFTVAGHLGFTGGAGHSDGVDGTVTTPGEDWIIGGSDDDGEHCVVILQPVTPESLAR